MSIKVLQIILLSSGSLLFAAGYTIKIIRRIKKERAQLKKMQASIIEELKQGTPEKESSNQ